MSRVGKAPIELPKGVSVDIDGSTVAVKGPKGALTRTLHPEMVIAIEDGVMRVTRPTDSRQHRSLHGLTRALLNNMVTGVSAGFTRVLQIEGVGYRAELDGKNRMAAVFTGAGTLFRLVPRRLVLMKGFEPARNVVEFQ